MKEYRLSSLALTLLLVTLLVIVSNLVGCTTTVVVVVTATPPPPTQTPWIITATPVSPAGTSPIAPSPTSATRTSSVGALTPTRTPTRPAGTSSAVLFSQALQIGKGTITAIAWFSKDKLLAVASQGIQLYDSDKMSPIRAIQVSAQVNAMTFSPDGSLLAAGCEDRVIRLWRVADCSPVRELRGHQFGITSVAFNPDGTLIASRLWKLR